MPICESYSFHIEGRDEDPEDDMEIPVRNEEHEIIKTQIGCWLLSKKF